MAKLVEKNRNVWYKLDGYEKTFYKQYQDGRLLQWRNEAAEACGHGLVLDDREEVVAQLAFERCFTYRTMERVSC